MKFQLTAVFRRFPDAYAAFVEELPGANTQGATLAEAVAMVREANRALAEALLRGQEVSREPFAYGEKPSFVHPRPPFFPAGEFRLHP